MLSSPNIGEDAATKNRQTITMRGISIFALPMIVVANIFYMFGLQTGLAENKPHDNLWFPGIQRSHNPTNIVGSPYDDFIRSKYCIDKSPCIAMLSASNHQGIRSEVNQVTLAKHSISDQDSSIIQKRILVREGYCAIYFCDVIIDFNKYNENRTMWLSDSGKHKVGPMPPHWNKVAALQRWFPHYDGILLMDMDSTWISFNHSIYDLYDETVTINYNGGGPELVMFKKHQISWAIVDSWWFFGTSPGCRYVKYPQNWRRQTQNLDMPWFWYAMVHTTQVFGKVSYECLDTCLGPNNYVNNIKEDPNHIELRQLWIYNCFEMYLEDVKTYTKAIISERWKDKYLNLNMAWGNKMNFSESFKHSVSVHYKDYDDMKEWLNRTVEVMSKAGCVEQSCRQANVSLLLASLS